MIPVVRGEDNDAGRGSAAFYNDGYQRGVYIVYNIHCPYISSMH